MQTASIEEIKREITESLKPINPEKVILFGSYADGTATEDSDVDLYVVTRDDFIPSNWREKTNVYLMVSKAIRNVRSKVAIDLIVHTRKMHEKFIQLNGFLAREITQRGVRLL